MLKILVVGVSSEKGGIENLFYNLFQNKCRFADIDFLSFGEECAFSELYRKNGYNIFVMPTRRSNPFLFKKRVKNFLKEHSDYDYIWVNTSCTSMYQFQLCAKKYTNSEVITHSHGTKFEQTSGVLSYLLNVVLSHLNYNKVVENTDLFFCCSVAAGIALFGEKYRDRLVVIKNAIDVDRFLFRKSKREYYKDELHIGSDAIVVAMIGRLCKAKNPLKGLQAFKTFHEKQNNSVLLIIGNGELEDLIRSEIKNANLSDCVKLLGFRSDVADLLSAVDILLMPSLYEGLPLAAIEAQCAGVTCFLSETITQEVKVSPLVHFLSLELNDEAWGTQIDENYVQVEDRTAFVQNVQLAGYDRNLSLKKVEELLCKRN